MGDVLSLVPPVLGDGIAIDSDQVLEAAKGAFTSLIMVGETADGEIQVRGTHGAPGALMLLQWGSQFLVNNRTFRAP